MNRTFVMFPQVNLRYGVSNPLSRTGTESDTCTACAGTMILEFAALSRLSGEAVFEVLMQEEGEQDAHGVVLRHYTNGILLF